MVSLIYPEHLNSLLSDMGWVESLAAHEFGIVEPLARWLRDGNHGYEEIPPGIRNEVFFKDLQTEETRPSALWREWGWSDTEMNGFSWIEKAHPEDRSFLRSNRNHSELNGVRVGQSVFRIIDSSGDCHWVLSSAAAILWSDDGELCRYIGRDVDISSRINRELALKEEIREAEIRSYREHALLEAAGKIAGVSDKGELLQAVEESIPDLLGMDGFRLLAFESGIYSVILGPQFPDKVFSDIVEIASADPDSPKSPCYAVSSDTESFTMWDIGDIKGKRAFAVFRYAGECNTESERLMTALGPIILRAWNQVSDIEVLRKDATTDPLTGVWNRRPFLEQAERRLRRNKEDGLTSVFALLDIDLFKLVNDKYGHSFGDRVLNLVSRGMEDSLRGVDLMCRWGGEEFAVYLEGLDENEALRTVERIRKSAGDAGSQGEMLITLSAGIRMIEPAEPLSLEDAMNDADKALLKAKGDGRNCIRLQPEYTRYSAENLLIR